MKEFHIISCGLSILSNAQKVGMHANVKLSQEDYWEKILENSQEIENLYDFLAQNPRERAAELNSFLRVVENRNPKDIEVYLFGTKTKPNELCRILIERYLKNQGFSILPTHSVSGYFAEAQIDPKLAIDIFQKDIADLLDRLLSLTRKKLQDRYQVYFNPTGGLKAHVMATALAGFLTNVQVYYLNEEFSDVVFLPRLFYLPKGNELTLLQEMGNRKIVSGHEAKKILEKYPDEVDRLLTYGILNQEVDQDGIIYRIKITEKGKLTLENLKKFL